MRIIHFIIFIFLLLFLTACNNPQDKISEFLQTDNATEVSQDYRHIITLLLDYQKKLNLRNPNAYDEQTSYQIKNSLKSSTNTLFIKFEDKYIENYNDYIKVAINDEKEIKNRNDFLILGVYKHIWDAYELADIHQVTTLSYDAEKLKSLYYALSVLKWKINTKKDKNNNYLFLTWQNNWQIELDKRLMAGEKPSWELIENLEYIKDKRETIFSHSNPNFEVLMSQMLYHVKNSLKIIGEEPLDIGIETMKTLVFFL